jgi:hypothetical protein
MSAIPVNLACEDELSEAVLRRLLLEVERGYAVGFTYRRGGFGYLRRTVAGWNSAAQSVPLVLLTDLDQNPCASALIKDWLPGPRHPNLLFRVAVREVESWVLADAEGLARCLGVPSRLIPRNPDNLLDPKVELIAVAARSRSSEVRTGIVPKPGSTARQGPDYNRLLVRFVQSTWNIDAACLASPSLARSVKSL